MLRNLYTATECIVSMQYNSWNNWMAKVLSNSHLWEIKNKRTEWTKQWTVSNWTRPHRLTSNQLAVVSKCFSHLLFLALALQSLCTYIIDLQAKTNDASAVMRHARRAIVNFLRKQKLIQFTVKTVKEKQSSISRGITSAHVDRIIFCCYFFFLAVDFVVSSWRKKQSQDAHHNPSVPFACVWRWMCAHRVTWAHRLCL